MSISIAFPVLCTSDLNESTVQFVRKLSKVQRRRREICRNFMWTSKAELNKPCTNSEVEISTCPVEGNESVLVLFLLSRNHQDKVGQNMIDSCKSKSTITVFRLDYRHWQGAWTSVAFYYVNVQADLHNVVWLIPQVTSLQKWHLYLSYSIRHSNILYLWHFLHGTSLNWRT